MEWHWQKGDRAKKIIGGVLVSEDGEVFELDEAYERQRKDPDIRKACWKLKPWNRSLKAENNRIIAQLNREQRK